MSSFAFDNGEEWLTGVYYAVKSYIEYCLLQMNENWADLYDIVEGFPADDTFDRKRMPLDKVLIHLDIDNINNPVFGFGDNVVDRTYDTPAAHQVIEVEAQKHVLHFDLGIWASERAGGGSARLVAYQRLTHMFHGTEAYRACSELAGVQIESFTGGRLIVETINDIKTWRVANISLTVQCFNRRFKTPSTTLETVASEGTIHIDDTVIVE